MLNKFFLIQFNSISEVIIFLMWLKKLNLIFPDILLIWWLMENSRLQQSFNLFKTGLVKLKLNLWTEYRNTVGIKILE